MPSQITLKQFLPTELILNADEARLILKFIFNDQYSDLIDASAMRASVISFTQAILLEAIDASHSIGYTHSV